MSVSEKKCSGSIDACKTRIRKLEGLLERERSARGIAAREQTVSHSDSTGNGDSSTLTEGDQDASLWAPAGLDEDGVLITQRLGSCRISRPGKSAESRDDDRNGF